MSHLLPSLFSARVIFENLVEVYVIRPLGSVLCFVGFFVVETLAFTNG
jgi:hypothetical protein